ncbi:hypothetical protein PENSPDRAFT_693253 [Peniophora sp. CONT]|nr:hypothetical protein PENSPDRAFT_693253 [Peniophora sp. CONT]
MSSWDDYEPSQEMSQLPEVLDRSGLGRDGRDRGNTAHLIGSGGYLDSQTTEDEYFGHEHEPDSEEDQPACDGCTEKHTMISDLQDERAQLIAQIQSLEAQLTHEHAAACPSCAEKDAEISHLNGEYEQQRAQAQLLKVEMFDQQAAALQREETLREEFERKIRECRRKEEERGHVRVRTSGARADVADSRHAADADTGKGLGFTTNLSYGVHRQVRTSRSSTSED